MFKRNAGKSGQTPNFPVHYSIPAGVHMKKKDFVSIRNYSTDELNELLTSAQAIKADPSKYSRRLEGKALALLLEKPSLRTRVSFDVGIHQLGGFSVSLSQTEISLGKRESIGDVAKNLERMVQGIMIRTFSHDIVEEMAGSTGHPCDQRAYGFQSPMPGDGGLHDRIRGKGPPERN